MSNMVSLGHKFRLLINKNEDRIFVSDKYINILILEEKKVLYSNE